MTILPGMGRLKQWRLPRISLEDHVAANYTASYIRLLYLMIPTPPRLSVKILGRWDFAARYADE